MSKISIVYITDQNFVMQTCVSICSLMKYKKEETHYNIYVVMAEAPEGAGDCFFRYPDVTLINVSLDAYKDIKQLAHIPIACLLKFDICDLIPQADKLIYIDGDTIILDDLTGLYETGLGDAYAAAVLSMRGLWEPEKRINAGVMVFNAKKMREDGMRDKLVETRMSLGNRSSMDQQSFNLLLGNQIVHLPIRYNLIVSFAADVIRRHPIEEINTLYATEYSDFSAMVDDAAIVHFATDMKPWLYSHIPFAVQWREFYKATPFGGEPLVLHGRWWVRRKRIRSKIKQKGLKGLADYIAGVFRRRVLKKDEHSSWG